MYWFIHPATWEPANWRINQYQFESQTQPSLITYNRYSCVQIAAWVGRAEGRRSAVWQLIKRDSLECASLFLSFLKLRAPQLLKCLKFEFESLKLNDSKTEYLLNFKFKISFSNISPENVVNYTTRCVCGDALFFYAYYVSDIVYRSEIFIGIWNSVTTIIPNFIPRWRMKDKI